MKIKKDIEHVILNRCKEKDQQAQLMIYERYCGAMYNTSLRIVKNNQEAEDIMQEAFLDAFEKLDQYQGKSTFGAWLKRIVINKSLDSIRQQILYEDIDQIEDPTEGSYTYFEKEPDTYKTSEIKKALQMLSQKDRIILILYLFEGYDHTEIAQILEISHASARTRYSRARKNLVKKINQTRTLHSYLS